MALKQPSLILWGLQITTFNRWIDYQLSSGGTVYSAQLNLGYYSLTSLLTEITRAMSAASASVTYTATADRTIAGGLQNRITLGTSSAYFKILFNSGTHAATSIASLIGFAQIDKSGSTSYTGSSSAGIVLVTTYPAFNYMPPELNREVQGSRSISAAGIKEAIVFQIMQFISAEFKYEPYAKVLSDWYPFFDWAMQQRPFDLTEDYTIPNRFFEVTLEKTTKSGDGLGQLWKEMLPSFPGLYTTQDLTFRVVLAAGQFII